MLIAQALGEYGMLSALADGIGNLGLRFEELAGEWGVEGVLLLVGAFILWRALTSSR